MKKFITMSIVTILCCLFSINSVNAEEGHPGTRGVICKYCNGKTCYYIAQNVKATKTNDYDELTKSNDRQRIFKKNGEEIELYYSEGNWEWDGNYHMSYIFNPKECSESIYYISQTRSSFFGTTHFYYFIQDIVPDSFLDTILHPNLTDANVKNPVVMKLFLKYQYGIDFGLNDTRIPGKINELVELTKDDNIENEGKVGCAVLTGPILDKLNWFFNILKYGGSALAILLGSIDFLKAVLSDEDKATNKAAQKFLKRIIAAVLIFLLPLIIQFVLNNIEIEGFNKDAPTCGIGVSEE